MLQQIVQDNHLRLEKVKYGRGGTCRARTSPKSPGSCPTGHEATFGPNSGRHPGGPAGARRPRGRFSPRLVGPRRRRGSAAAPISAMIAITSDSLMLLRISFWARSSSSCASTTAARWAMPRSVTSHSPKGPSTATSRARTSATSSGCSSMMFSISSGRLGLPMASGGPSPVDSAIACWRAKRADHRVRRHRSAPGALGVPPQQEEHRGDEKEVLSESVLRECARAALGRGARQGGALGKRGLVNAQHVAAVKCGCSQRRRFPAVTRSARDPWKRLELTSTATDAGSPQPRPGPHRLWVLASHVWLVEEDE